MIAVRLRLGGTNPSALAILSNSFKSASVKPARIQERWGQFFILAPSASGGSK